MSKKVYKKIPEHLKKKRGVPSIYNPKVYDSIVKMLAGLGRTQKEMSKELNISLTTFVTWRKVNPSFNAAVIEGKRFSDEEVEISLYQRAIGYSHPDIHITSYQGVVTQTKIMKYYPPETTACIFWLKNRDKENWKDKQTVSFALDDSDFVKETPAQIAEKMDNLTASPADGNKK